MNKANFGWNEQKPLRRCKQFLANFNFSFIKSNIQSLSNFVSIAFETSKGWLNLTLWSRMQITVSCWVNSTWMCVIQSYEPFPNQYHHQQICMSLLNTNSLLNQFVSYDFAQSLLNQSLFQVFVEYLLLFWGWISIW